MSEQTADADPGLPYAVLEVLDVGGGLPVVRIVGTSNDESVAHVLAETMARAGCRVWLLDLWGSGDNGPRIERYPNLAAVAWAQEHGQEITARGGADRASEAGR